MEFSEANLRIFENDFFGVPGKYPNQRYGQAFMNAFNTVIGLDVFYEESDLTSRAIVWTKLYLSQGDEHERQPGN